MNAESLDAPRGDSPREVDPEVFRAQARTDLDNTNARIEILEQKLKEERETIRKLEAFLELYPHYAAARA